MGGGDVEDFAPQSGGDVEDKGGGDVEWITFMSPNSESDTGTFRER